MIRFGPEICGDLDAALSREWLETNALGGFASSTICGAHTRRYHGLLVAATVPPVERKLLLSKVEETVTTSTTRFELGCNLFEGAVHPQGQTMLEEFRLDPWPVWRWTAGGVRLEKSVLLVQSENTLVVEYRLTDTSAFVLLDLQPLIAFRDYHATTHANASLNGNVEEHEGIFCIKPYEDLPSLYFSAAGAVLNRTGYWSYRHQYPRERERGLDYEEDLFQPFSLRFKLTPGRPVRLIVSTESPGGRDPARLIETERARRQPPSVKLIPALRRAAGQFLVSRGPQTTVIAGYHWFTDWGRDTMISLPGLALSMHKPDVARSVLLALIPWLHQGLLPNRFPDAGAAPEYNSTDATLWFVEALRAYAKETGDYDFVQVHCYPALKEIVEWRERGTLFGIRIDSHGLLTGGAPGVQLTWMDAKVGDRVITPRDGKPVEIQALWYNALCVISEFAMHFGDFDFAARCDSIAGRARGAFIEQFWNPAENCLFDVVNGREKDASIRPNQLLALSLPHRILDLDYGARVLEVVQRDLLTPFGLRTLSPRDSRYRARYEGDQSSRDEAYHQGTVWPWLLGPYTRAHAAVHGADETHRILAPFHTHLLDAGIGQISEIFDGDSPHTPRGCIAQAWSVGELLRIASSMERIPRLGDM